jgi:hypothetical protein
MLVPVAAPAAPAATLAAAPAVAASGSVTCPQCGTAALPGEAFCDNCGAPLSAPPRAAAPAAPAGPSALPPQPSYPPPQPAAPPSYGQPSVPTLPPSAYTPPPTPSYTPPPAPAPAYTPPAPAPTAGAYRAALAPAKLTVALTGAVIQLPNAVQATLGRADPVSGFFPEVDFTPHGALDNGVGRKHARLFVQSGQVLVEDLDSTNGTKVNGQKLAAHRPQALRSGDEITLGSMALRFSEY